MGARCQPLAWLPLLALPRLSAGLRLEHGLPRESLDCLTGKTIYFAGNSISRGIYFTLAALLENGDDFNSSMAFWRDRPAQKKLCTGGPLGFLSCKYAFRATGTTLVTSHTQRLELLEEDLEKAIAKLHPDVVVMEVGLDHACKQAGVDEQGVHAFEKELDEHFERMAAVMERDHSERATRFIWRAVSHFDQSLAWSPEWQNTNVDLWNQQLHQHLQKRGFLEADWFQWYSRSAELIDQALVRQGGWGMEDWIHPDSNTMARLTVELLPSLCK